MPPRTDAQAAQSEVQTALRHLPDRGYLEIHPIGGRRVCALQRAPLGTPDRLMPALTTDDALACALDGLV